jgi:hypothetical protein
MARFKLVGRRKFRLFANVSPAEKRPSHYGMGY